MYTDILENLADVNYFKKRTILAPTLEFVAHVNNHMMCRLPGDEKFMSSDSICIEEGNMESELDAFSPEILNGINCSEYGWK